MTNCAALQHIPYLLREDPMVYFIEANHPRIKNEEIALTKKFDIITEDDIEFNIMVERIRMATCKDFFRAMAVKFSCYYIFNLQYPPKLEATCFMIQKFLLRISDKSNSPSKVLKLISNIKKHD